MKNIILCEGKTDAILLSYYLEKVAGWKFNIKLTKNIGLPIRDFENEEASVYLNGERELTIWAVGGVNNMDYSISSILEATKVLEREKSYNKLIILMDRDKAEDDSKIFEKIKTNITNQEIHVDRLSNNDWCKCNFTNEFEEENEIQILPIIIPFDKYGALETFLMDAICEFGEEEAFIVNKSKVFISSFNLSNYLKNQRLKLKGELAVTLGTMFPEKTFTPIDTMLKQINWEEYRTIQEGFRKLEEI